MANDIITKLVNDICVELSDEFDQNFERKAFFTEKWKETRMPNQQGSLMARSGNLRKSIQSHQTDTTITWSSSLPYASIHNQGGEIKVTHKMKSFFWAMFYKSGGKEAEQQGNSLTQEQQAWKFMALSPVGKVITIPQRQFIGDHPEVNRAIEQVFEDNKAVFEQYLNTHFGI